MADILIYIPNYITQKDPFCIFKLEVQTLNTQLNELTNQKSSQQSPKLSSQRIRKRYYRTLETSVINSPLSLISLRRYTSYLNKGSPNSSWESSSPLSVPWPGFVLPEILYMLTRDKPKSYIHFYKFNVCYSITF